MFDVSYQSSRKTKREAIALCEDWLSIIENKWAQGALLLLIVHFMFAVSYQSSRKTKREVIALCEDWSINIWKQVRSRPSAGIDFPFYVCYKLSIIAQISKSNLKICNNVFLHRARFISVGGGILGKLRTPCRHEIDCNLTFILDIAIWSVSYWILP